MKPKITLSLTVWNRPTEVIESFRQVHNDERIAEVVVSDDHSTIENYKKMERNLRPYPKVNLFRNDSNRQVYENKMISVREAKSDWCIVFDSDNILKSDYLDKLYQEDWYEGRVLAPSFAKPKFDYRKFADIIFDKETIKPWLDLPRFECLLNTMNYFVHRDSYLRAWEPELGITGSDSIHFNYLWLKSDGQIKVVDGMEYIHPIHPQSNYIVHARKSAPMCSEDLEKIRRLS